jgi:DNA-binding NarL/FixJ family response regulator
MKILLADDHALIRSGLRCELAALAEAIDFVAAWNADTLLRMFEQHRDLDCAGRPDDARHDGARTIGVLRTQYPAVPLVVVSGLNDTRQVQEVLRAGAVGFIPKSAVGQLVLPAIRLVLAGGQYLPPQLMSTLETTEASAAASDPPMRKPAESSRVEALSPRQEEVFDLMAKGLSNKMIARQLNISEGTVKSHIATIFDVLRVHNRVSAIAAARMLSGDAEGRRMLGD